MNCDPFDAALVGGSQGHCLNIESYCPHCNQIALLYLCCKRPVLRNGGVILNETLLNCSIATFYLLPLIRHFHLVAEMDQVATSQHHFHSYTLLPSCTTFLRLLGPILRYVGKIIHLVSESSQLLVVNWHRLKFPIPIKNWL
jgi:hypothetical protein